MRKLITFGVALMLMVSMTIAQTQTAAPRPDVWTITGASQQEVGLTRILKGGIIVRYTKPAQGVMKTSGVVEDVGFVSLSLTAIRDKAVEKQIVLNNPGTTEVWVVRYDRQTDRGVIPELRVVFYTTSSYSQLRIFDLGMAYAPVVEEEKKSSVTDKFKDGFGGTKKKVEGWFGRGKKPAEEKPKKPFMASGFVSQSEPACIGITGRFDPTSSSSYKPRTDLFYRNTALLLSVSEQDVFVHGYYTGRQGKLYLYNTVRKGCSEERGKILAFVQGHYTGKTVRWP